MAMRPCGKCLENNWKFEKNDNLIIATCIMCGNEIQFEPTKRKTEYIDGMDCPKCTGIIHLKESPFNKKKLNKPYYYNAYYKCDKCEAMFMSDKFKIINKDFKICA